MKTKGAKLESESCVEEFLIIIKLRLKLLLSRLGETEGTDIIKAEDSTSSPDIKTTPKNEVRMEAVLYSEPRPAPDCAPRRLVRWFSAATTPLAHHWQEVKKDGAGVREAELNNHLTKTFNCFLYLN